MDIYCLFCGETPTKIGKIPREDSIEYKKFYKCGRCGYTWCISCVKRGGGYVSDDKDYAYCPRCPNAKINLIYDGAKQV